MSGKPQVDISDSQWGIVKSILQEHLPDHEVRALGSRANWRDKWWANPFSDHDLTVIDEPPLMLDVFAALAEHVVESDLSWKVDVIDWATSSAAFRKIIERDKVVLQSLAPSDCGGRE